MTIAELTERMRHFMTSGWNAELMLEGDNIIGYALYQFRRDDYDPDRQDVYLRQFYIAPDHRGKGYGKTAIQRLRAERFGYEVNIVIDVLSTNPRGKSFWDSIGFQDYCVTMRLPPI